MAKQKIGSILQKVLVIGDENLLTSHEILIQQSEEFKAVLKERREDGTLETYVLVPIDNYIEEMRSAFDEGTKVNS